MNKSTLYCAFILVAPLVLNACQGAPSSQPTPPVKDTKSTYQQCLEDNMAVAMAWEAIEQMCQENSKAPASLLPDK